MYKMKSKMVKTISSTVYFRSTILVPITEKNLPVADTVNGEVKRKSARYATT